MNESASKRLEEVIARVAASPANLRAILEESPDALVVFSLQRKIVGANAAAELFSGYGRHELDGQSIDVLVPERIRQPDAPPPVPLKELTTVELPSLRKDGTEVSTIWIYGFAPTPNGPVFVMRLLDRQLVNARYQALQRSDARFHNLLLATSSVVWVSDANGRFIEPQRSWEEYTGQTWQEHQGAEWLSAIHPDDRMRVMSDWTTASQAGSDGVRTHGRVWNAQHKAWRAFAARGVPIRNSQGEIIEWIGALNDIQDVLDAQLAARAAEQRYRALVDADIIGVIVGVETKVTEANDAFLRLFKRTQADVAAHRIDLRDMTPPGFEDVDQRAARQLHGAGIVAPYEKELIRADGVRVPVLVGAARLEAEPLRWISYVLDLTERKKAESSLEETNRHLLAADRTKDEFLATVSHELRTPLNAILGWSTILKAGPRDPEKLEKGLAVIERNARAQERIVGDILDVSRIISGKLRLHVRRMEVSSAIYAAADVVRPAAESKGVRLLVDLDPRLGATIADPDRLQQVVWNLLTNAVRFTPPGGRVTLTAERGASGVCIRVVDTGQGIAPEHLPFIFDRFRQVDSSITRRHSGMGLGLAIVRHLVEAHGGAVEATSAGVGQGATFTITLPMRPVDTAEPAAVDGESSARESASSMRTVMDGLLAGTRVLVVEDDVDSLEVVATVLETAGAHVTACTTAADALAEQGPFDMVVSDIGMPDVDGFSFIRRFRAREHGGDVPAIALSAYARAEDIERAHRAGFQEHLAKPIDAVQLVEKLARWARQGESDGAR